LRFSGVNLGAYMGAGIDSPFGFKLPVSSSRYHST
jgi:hypothetical protein